MHVVPRTWAHLLAEAAGDPLDPATATPTAWQDLARVRTGVIPPDIMTERAPASFVPFSSGHDAADPIDRAIVATRNAVFPLHGLPPLG